MPEHLIKTSRILIVDDDPLLRQVLREQLTQHGVGSLFEAETVTMAMEQAEKERPDLILLDVQLPDGNGFDFCRKLRELGFDQPVIMLTGQDGETDIVTGLDCGANDYVAKPMRMNELLARIRSQLRQFKASDDVRFEIGRLNFIPADKTITDSIDGRMITLTEKETLLLKRLFRVWPESVSRDSLLSDIWGYGEGLTTHTIETHIYRLRQKLKRLHAYHIIKTIQDGYQLDKTEVTTDD